LFPDTGELEVFPTRYPLSDVCTMPLSPDIMLPPTCASYPDPPKVICHPTTPVALVFIIQLSSPPYPGEVLLPEMPLIADPPMIYPPEVALDSPLIPS